VLYHWATSACLQPTLQSYRERSHPSVTRKAKNP